MSAKPPLAPRVDKSEEKTDGKEKGKKLSDEKSDLAVNILMNQALSYMIDNGMVEMDDEIRTLNVMHRENVVKKADSEGLSDDVFKEIGKISTELMNSEKEAGDVKAGDVEAGDVKDKSGKA